MTPKPISLVLVVAVAIILTGCVQRPPHVIPTSEPKAAPVFKSDAEALAAAKKAYLAYLKVSDQILMDGGKNPERLLAVATPAELKSQTRGFQEFQTKSWHSTGGTQISNIMLQGYFARQTRGIIRAYVCIDVSRVDVFDSNGESVVTSSRPSKQSVQVVFDSTGIGSHKLLLADQEPWRAKGVCA